MSLIYGLFSLLFGAGSFYLVEPAGVPVFGLAFAGAGFLREVRGSQSVLAYTLLGVATLMCVVGTLRSLHLLNLVIRIG